MELITHGQRERVPPLAGPMDSLPSVGPTPTLTAHPLSGTASDSALSTSDDVVHCQGRALTIREASPSRLDLGQLEARMTSGQSLA